MPDETEQYTAENDDKCSTQMEVKAEPPIQCFVVENHQETFQTFETANAVPSTADVGTMNLWTTKATNCLINQYKKYRSMVGQSTQIRSLREMFEMISVEMQNYGFYFSPQKCENKWRVLERKYKNLVFRERAKKPGRMRHYGHWEHKRALDEIFHDKRRHFSAEEDEVPSNNRIVPQTIGSRDTNDGAGQQQESQNSPSSSDPLTLTNQGTIQTEPLVGLLEKFFDTMKESFDTAEKNRERRHKEEMALRQSQLEIQKKLLQLEEQKMELQKNQMLAAAQHIHLNM